MDNVARKTGEQLKQTLLLLFVAVSVVLVGSTWVDGLREPQEKAPAYFRGVPQSPGDTAVLTPVPPAALAPIPAGSAPTATREHKNDHPTPAAPEPDGLPPTPDPFDMTQDQ